MNRVVITGVGVVGPTGAGTVPFLSALAEGRPLGEFLEEPGRRGRPRSLRVAKIPPFDRERFLPARKLRRMGELSQIWTLACLLARSDAGLEGEGASLPSPEMRGTFLGSGFGCTDTTWEYLEGMFRDGMAAASPFLFSESVANAPAGHSAIELDARGTCVTLTGGDASAAVAVGTAVRALKVGRLEVAYAGGLELMTKPLLHALAVLGGPSHLGEGSACLVLETLSSAKRRDARVIAEVAGSGIASDPRASATSWSTDPETFRAAMAHAWKAASRDDGAGSRHPGAVRLHACGSPASDEAEAAAAESIAPGVPRLSATPVFGSHAAAGGFNLVAAALEAASRGEVLLHAHAWGGSACSLVFRKIAG